MSEENQENPAPQSGTITIKKDSLWKYSTFILAALVIVIAIVSFSGNGPSPTTGNTVNTGTTGAQELPTEPERVLLNLDDDAVLGNANAPVTFLEFTDIQCPFCERQHSQVFPQVKSQYVDSGDVKYIIRDFPLTQIHPQALPAAIAAECVREQGGDEAYFKYTDHLFANQASLSGSFLKSSAQQVSGFNIDACLDAEKYNDEVQKDLQDGQAAGIRGTPGSFILMSKDNADVDALIAMQVPDGRGGWSVRYVEADGDMVGVRVSGALPIGTFQSAINAGL